MESVAVVTGAVPGTGPPEPASSPVAAARVAGRARALRGARGAGPPGPRSRAGLGRRHGHAPLRRVPRPRHLRVRHPAARPDCAVAVPHAPHAPVRGLHRRRARPARGAPRRALRVVVVHDRINAYAAEEAAWLPNGESFGLHCLAASTLAGKTDAGLRLLRDRGLAFVDVASCASKEFAEYVAKRARPTKEISPGAGILVNSCRALEGEFMDVVAGDLAADGKKYFAVGPLNPLLDLHADAQKQQSKPRHECLDWLDKQPPAPVLYVSFGTTSSLRTEQIAELAAALRDSGQRFVWVLREADRGNESADDDDHESKSRSRHAELLSKFTDQTEGRGMVITGWAPQLEILAHGATAAFMSHCGWNSTMESLSHGKPILAWPMHSDQPWDAELLCKYLNAGMLVRPWEKHDEVIPAKAIRQVIEDAMLSDQGVAVRQRAKLLGDAVRACLAEGGSSRKDLSDFIAHVTK